MTDQPATEVKDRIVRDEKETATEAALGDFLQAKLDQGWTRDGHWRHPTDPDKSMLIDPFSGEVIFSRKYSDEIDADPDAVKYLEVLHQDIERQRQGGQP
jgi:hypothetical protein